MNIVHISMTPVAGAAWAWSQAMREIGHDSQCIAPKEYGDGRVMPTNFDYPPDVRGIRAIAQADVIFCHQGHPYKEDWYPDGIPTIGVYHSQPNARHTCRALEGDGWPFGVIGQWEERLYPGSWPLPNLLPLEHEWFQPKDKPKKIRIAYSPSNRTGRGWDNKGYSETVPILESLGDGVDIDIIEGAALCQCLARKATAHIVIDEVVTGAYHRSSLEGLALGCVVVNNCDDRCSELIRHMSGREHPFVTSDVSGLRATLEGLIALGPAKLARMGYRNRLWAEYAWDTEHLFERNFQPLIDAAMKKVNRSSGRRSVSMAHRKCKPAECDLSLVIVQDAEKDRKLIDYNLQALRDLNGDYLDNVQIVVVNQSAEYRDLQKSIAKSGLNAELVNSGDEFVGEQPLWDIVGTLARLRPHLRGKYLQTAHAEFIQGPDAIKNAMQWIHRQGDPPLVMGNLRRLGDVSTISRHYVNSSCKKVANRLKKLLRTGDVDEIRRQWYEIPSVHWKFTADWEVLQRCTGWQEDAFYARMDWLDAIRFFDHADRLLFQDVYDLFGVAWPVLSEMGMDPKICRVPFELSSIYHLWHTKGYLHFNEAVIDHFQENPEKWEGTIFLNDKLLRRLERFARDRSGFATNPLVKFRRQAGGTAYRWKDGITEWATNGGKRDLQLYYSTTGGLGSATSLDN